MRYQRGIALAGLLFATACTSDGHNDVLIFGTNTKFAVDVSASAATGGTPELTVGYKRQEAVWMPLLVNGMASDVAKELAAAQIAKCDALPDGDEKTRCLHRATSFAKYMGSAGGSGQFSGGGARATKDEHDAYSVFASFGARFGAEGNASSAEAQGGIAQFFATGIAAQRLGANASIGDALSVKPASEKSLNAAEARAEAAEEALETERASSFATTQAQARVDNVLSLVDTMQTGEAKDVLDNPPSPLDAFATSAVTARLGGNALGSTGANALLANDDAAKTVLKMVVSLIEDRSAENLGKWEAAIRAAQ